MIRDEIIKLLDYYDTSWHPNYSTLLESIGVHGDELDPWFKGVIRSLFYEPNHTVLILEGPQGIGKTRFFQHLLPNMNWWTQLRDCNSIYGKLIIDFEFEKKSLIVPNDDNFTIYDENAKKQVPPAADKRLVSYCGTTQKWVYPQRKNFIVHFVEKVDFELYNSIDKLNLWREIFNKFKP